MLSYRFTQFRECWRLDVNTLRYAEYLARKACEQQLVLFFGKAALTEMLLTIAVVVVAAAAVVAAAIKILEYCDSCCR